MSPSSATKLHLGCFDQPVDGWINADVTPHILVSRVPLLPLALRSIGVLSTERYEQHRAGIFKRVRRLDMTKRFPFGDNTMDAVFSCHVLEHLYRADARRSLAEMHRVLRPGGVCRIVVPDLDRVVASYDSENPEPFLNSIFETSRKSKNAHHWHYSAVSLGTLLQEIGFRQTIRRSFREGACPDLGRLDSRPDSLFMEGIK